MNVIQLSCSNLVRPTDIHYWRDVKVNSTSIHYIISSQKTYERAQSLFTSNEIEIEIRPVTQLLIGQSKDKNNKMIFPLGNDLLYFYESSIVTKTYVFPIVYSASIPNLNFW